MTAPPKRRWFRFTSRTLFVVVTIFGVWLGWQLKIVRERKAVVAEITRGSEATKVSSANSLANLLGAVPEGMDLRDFGIDISVDLVVSPVRRLLGDEPYFSLYMPSTLSERWIERAERAFPEAILIVLAPEPNDVGNPLAYRDSLYTPPADRKPNKGTIFKTGLIEKSSEGDAKP